MDAISEGPLGSAAGTSAERSIALVIATIAAGAGGAGSSRPGWACAMLDDAPRVSASAAMATQRVLVFMAALLDSWMHDACPPRSSSVPTVLAHPVRHVNAGTKVLFPVTRRRSGYGGAVYSRQRRTTAGLAAAIVGIGLLGAGSVVLGPPAGAAPGPAINGVLQVYPTLLSSVTASGIGKTDVIRMIGGASMQTLTTAELDCPNAANSPLRASSVKVSAANVATLVFPRPKPSPSATSEPVVCSLLPNGAKMPGLATQVSITYDPAGPVLAAPTPSGWAATPTKAPTIEIPGSGISAAATPLFSSSTAQAAPLNVPAGASAYMVGCTAVGGSGVVPIQSFAGTAASVAKGQFAFTASNGVPASTCDMVVAVQRKGGAMDSGFDLVASLAGVQGGGFAWTGVFPGVQQVYPTLLSTATASGTGGTDVIRVIGPAPGTDPTQTLQGRGLNAASLSQCTNTSATSYAASSVTLTPKNAIVQNGEQTGTVATLVFPDRASPTHGDGHLSAAAERIAGEHGLAPAHHVRAGRPRHHQGHAGQLQPDADQRAQGHPHRVGPRGALPQRVGGGREPAAAAAGLLVYPHDELQRDRR
jgi:hypothetical protein